MHSTIYEFSEQPISKKRWTTVDSLPEWFFQTVADSATDTDEISRAVQIRCLEQHFGDLCIAPCSDTAEEIHGHLRVYQVLHNEHGNRPKPGPQLF